MAVKYGKSKRGLPKEENEFAGWEIIEHAKRVIRESEEIREEFWRVSGLLRQTVERLKINCELEDREIYGLFAN